MTKTLRQAIDDQRARLTKIADGTGFVRGRLPTNEDVMAAERLLVALALVESRAPSRQMPASRRRTAA